MRLRAFHSLFVIFCVETEKDQERPKKTQTNNYSSRYGTQKVHRHKLRRIGLDMEGDEFYLSDDSDVDYDEDRRKKLNSTNYFSRKFRNKMPSYVHHLLVLAHVQVFIQFKIMVLLRHYQNYQSEH